MPHSKGKMSKSVALPHKRSNIKNKLLSDLADFITKLPKNVYENIVRGVKKIGSGAYKTGKFLNSISDKGIFLDSIPYVGTIRGMVKQMGPILEDTGERIKNI